MNDAKIKPVKTPVKSLSRNELTQFILELGEKPFRASQLWTWLYQKNAAAYEEMTNISKSFQNILKKSTILNSLKLIRTTCSAGNTQKFLWELTDGNRIESVYIPEKTRRTICISSQVGCAMGCTFCATAALGLIRNLTVNEIVEQVLEVQRATLTDATNIVVMGMGEPFVNYDNVMKALTILNHMDGCAFGHRKITISTSGIVPKIRQYADEGRPFKLAISLNSTIDEQRSRLMPINNRFPISELLQAARYYTKTTRKRITFEYVLIHGQNDSDEDAEQLLRLLKNIPCKVNLIAYNPTSEKFQRPKTKDVLAFSEKIRTLSAPVTLRLSKGDDIRAACGQLAGE